MTDLRAPRTAPPRSAFQKVVRMSDAAMELKEKARLRAVLGLQSQMGKAPDPDLQSLVETAALVCGTSISLVTLVGKDKQSFQAQVGLDGVHETDRDVSFCTHAIKQDLLFEVEDAREDWQFAANPFVVGPPGIRFYAGAPIVTLDGHNVGTLCVIDTLPRHLTDDQRQILMHLARVAGHILEANRLAWDQSLIAAEWKALNDAAPFGLYACDAEGQCTHVNQKWQKIYGLTMTDSLGDGWSRVLQDDDRNRVQQSWRDAVATGATFDQEFRVVRPDGRLRIVRSVARPVTDEGGRVVGLVGTVEDVTKARGQAQSLEERGRRLKMIVEATGVATVEWNIQTGEFRLSPEWGVLAGREQRDVTGSTLEAVLGSVHPDDKTGFKDAISLTTLPANGTFEFEYRRLHKLGHWIWVMARCRLMTRTADGKPEWVFSSQFDVTARKTAIDQLRRSEVLLSKTGEAACVGGWEYDLQTREVTWTNELRRIHGVPPDYVPSFAAALEVYTSESRALLAEAIRTAAKTGTAFDLELQLVRTDGAVIWIRAMGSAESKDGKPTRLFGAVQDISDRIARRNEVVKDHQRMVLATESTGIGIWETDLETQRSTFDRQTYRLFGHFSNLDLPDPGDVWPACVHPEDRERVLAEELAALQDSRRYESEFRIKWPDGTVRHIRSLADMVIDPRSEKRVLLGVNWDVTQLRALAEEVTSQHELMRVTLRSIGDAVITTDGHGVVTWLNPVAEAMTGWGLQEAIGRPMKQIYNILNEMTQLPAEDPVETALNELRVVALAPGTILVSRTGERYAIQDSAAPIRDDNGHIQGVVLVFRDVTVERRLRSEMAYRATHDTLTGIENRSEFEIRLGQLRQRAEAGDGVHSLLYIDLDNFKLVNDSCGHTAGDMVLQQVSQLLAGSIRARDMLARVGGDEFAILLEYCPAERAAQIGQQICDQMEVYRYTQDDRRFRIGTSIGVVAIDQRWTTSEAIIQAADAACLMAKETGRNRVRVWQDQDSSLALRRGEIGWAARLEQALDTDQFKLLVQEIRSLDPNLSGLHGEVLLRIEEADGSFILPGQFLPSAERFNLITQIDRWVMRETIRTLQNHPSMADIRSISLNISGKSLADRAFHRFAIAELIEAGPNLCQRLTIEITETSAVGNLVNASLFIEQLHALGVRVSLDDFGAGTASFGYLRALKVDCLKIDGQFVQGLLDDPLSRATVRCFTEVAAVLGIPTVAEYVDRDEILVELKALGVSFVQGHLIAQPVPILEFLLGAKLTLRQLELTTT